MICPKCPPTSRQEMELRAHGPERLPVSAFKDVSDDDIKVMADGQRMIRTVPAWIHLYQCPVCGHTEMDAEEYDWTFEAPPREE